MKTDGGEAHRRHGFRRAPGFRLGREVAQQEQVDHVTGSTVDGIRRLGVGDRVDFLRTLKTHGDPDGVSGSGEPNLLSGGGSMTSNTWPIPHSSAEISS